jgi:hypothetical protein
VVDFGTDGKVTGKPLSSSSSFSSISRSYSGLMLRSGEEGTDVAGDVSPDKELGRVNESPNADGLAGEEEELDDVEVLMIVIPPGLVDCRMICGFVIRSDFQ